MNAAVRSMTGFSRVRRTIPEGELVISLKSLNHRGLDIHFHASSLFDPVENDMRALVKRNVTRGHVEVRVSLARAQGAVAGALNQALLEAYLAAFRASAMEHGLKQEPDLNAALRIPGMFVEEQDEETGAELQKAVLELLEQAFEELNRFRAREGAELVAGMLGHNAGIRAAAEQIEEIRTRAVSSFQTRLSDRLKELLRGAGIEPQRLAQEVAILADRSDVGEELARLKIHSAQLEQLLTGRGEVGKKLDFLLQEMNRETNTILSKTTGIGELGLKITELALAAKAEIEKIREQALNLE